MCLTIPAKIIKISQGKALAEDYNNQKKEILITAIKDIEKDDWVLINGNLAIQKISPEEAQEIINILK